MNEILVATPLSSSSVTRQYTFSNGISVQRIKSIQWNSSGTNDFLSENDRQALAETEYWLCASKQATDIRNEGHDLYETVRRAMYAVQIIHPSGCKNVYLEFRRMEGGFDNIGSCHSTCMKSTGMGNLACLEHQGFAQDFERVYAGVEHVFSKEIVRLQNPIRLMEHGLRIVDVYPLSTLFWVMGLDMLFIVRGSQTFIERINGFLVPETHIFPRTRDNQSPNCQVQEVLGGLYKFRNIVAHGREIPKSPYRKEYVFMDTEGFEIVSGYYAELMQESALFLLCKSLRKIFVEGLVDEVKDASKWRQRLKLGAKVT